MQAVDAAKDQWRQAESAWENITWAIMQNPEIGVALNEGGKLRVVEYPGSTIDDEPTIAVVFEQTGDGEIVLRDVRFSKATYGGTGSA